MRVVMPWVLRCEATDLRPQQLILSFTIVTYGLTSEVRYY
jgi:hypothetical protein